MKSNWKNIAVAVLVVVGGVSVGVAALSGAIKSRPAAVATMSDPSMVSMQSDNGTCEMCSGSDQTKCTTGNCSGSSDMMSMTMDKPMSMAGNTMSSMAEGKMSEGSMVNTASPSMAGNSMAPSMDSGKMSGGEQMVAVPKM